MQTTISRYSQTLTSKLPCRWVALIVIDITRPTTVVHMGYDSVLHCTIRIALHMGFSRLLCNQDSAAERGKIALEMDMTGLDGVKLSPETICKWVV